MGPNAFHGFLFYIIFYTHFLNFRLVVCEREKKNIRSSRRVCASPDSSKILFVLINSISSRTSGLKVCINFGFTWSYAIHVSQSLHNFFVCLHEKSFSRFVGLCNVQKE